MPDVNTATGDQVKRLRRIEGQVRGIARMVEEDQYCIDILTQVSSASRALQSVALALLDEHIHRCLVDAARAGGTERQAGLQNASEAIARLVRS
jgi:CsoR family transcriptional regulator, copper-sensing transcriptional repressor